MNILFLNIPPAITKKPGNGLYWFQSSMNLGLLAVASDAENQGHNILMLDWLGENQFDLEANLPNILKEFNPKIVGFSVPSGYAESRCKNISSIIKKFNNTVFIIAGGQYQVGMRPVEFLMNFENIDAVATKHGEGLDWNRLLIEEDYCHQVGVLRRGQLIKKNFGANLLQSPTHSQFNFSLYENKYLKIRDYAPSIEYSRGCPFTCSFCSLSGAPSKLQKSQDENIYNQLLFWVNEWKELDKVPIYVECPVFYANEKNIKDIESIFKDFSSRIQWRTQVRADSVSTRVLRDLAELGLSVFDVGLESASPVMLKRMKKTANPKKYLERASSLLYASNENNIKVKLNILLYPGETWDTIEETEEFIRIHKELISGVSIGSTMIFPGTFTSAQLDNYQSLYGTQLIFQENLCNSGVFPMDLSTEVSYVKAREWAIRISKMVMDDKSYFELKKIGYYSPSVTYRSFQDVISKFHPDALPFSVSHDFKSNYSEFIGVSEWDRIR